MEKKSYLTPKAKKKKSRTGWGIFAIEAIDQGELIIDFTDSRGEIIDMKEAARRFEQGNDHMIQISDESYFADTIMDIEDLEDVDMINHSCRPNCGMQGNFKIVATRDIAAGEETTIDYAMVENSDYELECMCGNNNCRGTISGYDWEKRNYKKNIKAISPITLPAKFYNINIGYLPTARS